MEAIIDNKKMFMDFGIKISDIEEIITLIKEENKSYPKDIGDWFHSYSIFDISNGVLGYCLYLAELDRLFPLEGYDRLAHAILVRIINTESMKYITDPGLWSGLAGICFTVKALSKDFTRYNKLLSDLNSKLINLVDNKLELAYKNLMMNKVKMEDFDLMEGLAGICIYLSEVIDVDDKLKDLYERCIEYLTKIILLEKDFKGSKIPMWHTESEDQFLDFEKRMFPDGMFNLGVSHGIIGVLNTLIYSVEFLRDNRKIKESIREVSNWLLNRHMTDKKGNVCWNKKMSFKYYLEEENVEVSSNLSWCYGDFMILKALWEASDILGDNSLKDFSLKSLSNYDFNNHSLISPTYCHGISGVLHSAFYTLKKIEIPNANKALIFLENELNSLYKKELVFGFEDIETYSGELYKFNKPGFLTGAMGIYLTLLIVKYGKSETGWEKLFHLK